MRTLLILSIAVFCLGCPAVFASDWIVLADRAVSLSADDVLALEGKTDKTLSDLYQLTIHYYRHYNHDALVALFDETKDRFPADSEARVLEAIILMRNHRPAESCAVLDRVLARQPDFHPARIVLAHLLYLQKDFQGAYAVARRLLVAKEALSNYHYLVSLLIAAGARGILAKKHPLSAIGAYFEVTGYFHRARTILPESPEYLYGQGSYYLLTPRVAGGDLNRAIDLLERSRRLTPCNATVYVRLAQAYRARGDEAACEKYLAAAARIDPEDELLLDDLSGRKDFLDVP